MRATRRMKYSIRYSCKIITQQQHTVRFDIHQYLNLPTLPYPTLPLSIESTAEHRTAQVSIMKRQGRTSLSLSLSFILSIASNANAFVTHNVHLHRHHHHHHSLQHEQHQQNLHQSLQQIKLLVPWTKRSFSRRYGAESGHPNEDIGVIVPEDGFGSPCVIKVSKSSPCMVL